MLKVHALAQYRDLDKADLNIQRDVGNILDSLDSKCCWIFDFSLAISYYLNNCNLIKIFLVSFPFTNRKIAQTRFVELSFVFIMFIFRNTSCKS